MLTNMAASVDERILEKMIETHPLKKLLTTEEVAETIQFMVNAPQQMNGVNIVINSAKNI
jgi:NADP-dependent 3-hydroxy acid dehydrogenase YdfG